MLSYFLEKTVKIVNDLINARGVYLILRVQGGAFNRKKAFKREVTSSTKPNMLPRKYQERFKIYSGISTPSIVTSRPPRDPSICILLFQIRSTPMSESRLALCYYCVAIVSLPFDS